MSADFSAVAAQLLALAKAMAEARVAALVQRDRALHWRDARLLWPDFGKGTV